MFSIVSGKNENSVSSEYYKMECNSIINTYHIIFINLRVENDLTSGLRVKICANMKSDQKYLFPIVHSNLCGV